MFYPVSSNQLSFNLYFLLLIFIPILSSFSEITVKKQEWITTYSDEIKFSQAFYPSPITIENEALTSSLSQLAKLSNIDLVMGNTPQHQISISLNTPPFQAIHKIAHAYNMRLREQERMFFLEPIEADLIYAKTYFLDGRKLRHEGVSRTTLTTIQDAIEYMADQLTFTSRYPINDSIGRLIGYQETHNIKSNKKIVYDQHENSLFAVITKQEHYWLNEYIKSINTKVIPLKLSIAAISQQLDYQPYKLLYNNKSKTPVISLSQPKLFSPQQTLYFSTNQIIQIQKDFINDSFNENLLIDEYTSTKFTIKLWVENINEFAFNVHLNTEIQIIRPPNKPIQYICTDTFQTHINKPIMLSLITPDNDKHITMEFNLPRHQKAKPLNIYEVKKSINELKETFKHLDSLIDN